LIVASVVAPGSGDPSFGKWPKSEKANDIKSLIDLKILKDV
jgi:hypothetical protein